MSKNNIEQRKAYVAEVTDKIKNSSSVVLVDYRGINVEQDTAMRKAMREAGIEYRVIKNSALSRAFEATGNTGYDRRGVRRRRPDSALPRAQRVCGQNPHFGQVRSRRGQEVRRRRR